MYEIKFACPVGVTQQQARAVWGYMQTYYRLFDVLEIIDEQRNDDEPESVAFYDKASDKEQEKILFQIANLSLSYQEKYNDMAHWRDAVESAFCDVKALYIKEGVKNAL